MGGVIRPRLVYMMVFVREDIGHTAIAAGLVQIITTLFFLSAL